MATIKVGNHPAPGATQVRVNGRAIVLDDGRGPATSALWFGDA